MRAAAKRSDEARGEASSKDGAKRSDEALLKDALSTEEGAGTGFEEKAKKKRKAADKYSEEMEKEQAEAPRPVEEGGEQEITRSQQELRLEEQKATLSEQDGQQKLIRREREIERAPAKEAKAEFAQLPDEEVASSVLEEDAPSMKADLAQFSDGEAASPVLEEAREPRAPDKKSLSGAAGGDADLGPSAEVSEPSPMRSSLPMPPAPSMPPAEIPPIALGKAPYPQQAPIEAPARSKSAFSALGRIISTILMFPLIVLAAPFAALYWVGKQIKRGVGWMFSRSRAALEKKAQEKGVKLYELFLSEEATKPGPIERTIAQSKVLLRVVSAFFGLWTVALLCFVDAVLSVFTQYAHKLLGYWKTLKSKGKTFLRKRNRTLHQGMAEDLMKLRLQLSQLLLMPGFSPQECAASISKEELKALVLSPTFPLHQVLEARCRLDEVKTDIGGLSSFHLQTFLKKAVKGGILQVGEKILDLFKHIVPNPFLFVRGWKDLYLMWRYMRYSRRELLEMYARLVDDFQTLLAMSLESANAKDAEKDVAPETIEPVLMALFPYEEALFERLGLQRNSLLQKSEMNQRLAVEATQRDMQRLLQVMCLAGRFLLPQRWSRAELLLEYQAMSANNRFSPQVALEVEAWLDQEVKQIIDSTKILAPHEEFEAQLQEEALRKSRQRALRKIVKQRGFWV
ncbi:hypothetical protein L6R29_07595 [Myxococcota bacterium]|nr:hypothetical protein [Myxococcota bacterium]